MGANDNRFCYYPFFSRQSWTCYFPSQKEITYPQLQYDTAKPLTPWLATWAVLMPLKPQMKYWVWNLWKILKDWMRWSLCHCFSLPTGGSLLWILRHRGSPSVLWSPLSARRLPNHQEHGRWARRLYRSGRKWFICEWYVYTDIILVGLIYMSMMCYAGQPSNHQQHGMLLKHYACQGRIINLLSCRMLWKFDIAPSFW